jgi:hypothetical protein
MRRIGLQSGYVRDDASGRSFGIPFAFCDFSRLCREEKFPAPARRPVFRQRDYSAPNGQSVWFEAQNTAFVLYFMRSRPLCIATHSAKRAIPRLP